MHGMGAVRAFIVAVLATVVLALPAVVLADGRVALVVVGNSTYAHIGRLPNPDNDARDMSAVAAARVRSDDRAGRRPGGTDRGAPRVTRRSAGADVSLVFYAGHGIEMDGVNYLVPVDARLERDVDVRFETVTVDDLLVSTSGASLRLVILDACRNNPLARSMQRTAATRTVSGGSFSDLNEDLLGFTRTVVVACGGTAWRRCVGIALRPTREKPGPSTASAGCTKTVVACGGIAWRPSAGTVWQLRKDLSRHSTAFSGEGRTGAVMAEGDSAELSPSTRRGNRFALPFGIGRRVGCGSWPTGMKPARSVVVALLGARPDRVGVGSAGGRSGGWRAGQIMAP